MNDPHTDGLVVALVAVVLAVAVLGMAAVGVATVAGWLL